MKSRIFPLILSVLVVATLVWAMIINLRNAWPAEELGFIKENQNLTYDQKMAIKLGEDFYAYAKFISTTLPQDAVVYLPPHATYPWPGTGNPGYINFFLYPRVLISGKLTDQTISPSVTHALLVWGETGAADPSLYGWPKIEIPAKQIIYFDTKTGQTTILENTTYRLEDPRNKNAWGVIKVAQ